MIENTILPDTHVAVGIPAFATLAGSTYMDFSTIGDTKPKYCSQSSNFAN